MGHPCQHILFFDDVEENAIGAQKCGMHAVHVTDSATVAAAITPLAAEPHA
jgi:FMN phosphatase YigB (HAD superfamily)